MDASRAAPGYFGERAGRYDAAYDETSADGYALRSRMRAVVALVGDGPGDLLDAGMGAGRLLGELAGRGWTVSGLDASAEMVEAARERLPEAAGRFHVGPIEHLPFPDGSFDVVTATGVLEYTLVTPALAEAVRVLRPGGRAIVSYPNPRAAYGLWKTRVWYPGVRSAKRAFRRANPQMPHGAGELPQERFVQELERAGLKPQQTIFTSFVPLLTPVEHLLPRVSVALGERLERRAPGTRKLFGTQIVYEAARPPQGRGNA
jgi:ubiquinone/menaquinone biosynthesis C-methylase UbiE